MDLTHGEYFGFALGHTVGTPTIFNPVNSKLEHLQYVNSGLRTSEGRGYVRKIVAPAQPVFTDSYRSKLVRGKLVSEMEYRLRDSQEGHYGQQQLKTKQGYVHR